jgi:hypothetical protein|tara:strand:+ start:544 stop:780 length:237 start_codon:yes stop_codon:yes gene_type:complete
MKNVIELVSIIVIAFLLVFLTSAIIFTIIVPLNNPFAFQFSEILIVIFKLVVSFSLFIIWIFIIQKIITSYLKKKLNS